jgi:hypothetical protein
LENHRILPQDGNRPKKKLNVCPPRFITLSARKRIADSATPDDECKPAKSAVILDWHYSC